MSDRLVHEGVPIAYRETGDGAHLTLLHGVGGAMDNWDGVVAALGPGFRCLACDLRGHGASGSPPGRYRLEHFVGDVRALLDARGVASTHLVGFSFGAMIAQAFALAHPKRISSLVLVSAVCGRTAEERDAVLARARALTRGETGAKAAAAAAAAERWFTPAFREAHPETIEARLRQLLANDPVGYPAAYQVFAESDLADRIGGIRVPVLIMTGEHDTGSSPRMARLMHERIPGSRLEILPDLRHSVLLEAPELVARQLRSFLAPAGASGSESPRPGSPL